MQKLTQMIELPKDLIIPDHPIGDRLKIVDQCLKLSLGGSEGLLHKPGAVLSQEKKNFQQQAVSIIANGKMYFADAKKFIAKAQQASKIKKEIATLFCINNDIIIEHPYIQESQLVRRIGLTISLPNTVGTLHSHPEPSTFSTKDIQHITSGELLFILLFNTARNHWAILTRDPNSVVYEINISTLTTYTKFFVSYLSSNQPNIFKEIQKFFPSSSQLYTQMLYILFPKILNNLGYIYQEAPTPETLFIIIREIFSSLKETAMKQNPPTKQGKHILAMFESDPFWDTKEIYERFGEPVPTAEEFEKFLDEHVVPLTPEEQKIYRKIERRCNIANAKMAKKLKLQQARQAKKNAIKAKMKQRTKVQKKIK